MWRMSSLTIAVPLIAHIAWPPPIMPIPIPMPRVPPPPIMPPVSGTTWRCARASSGAGIGEIDQRVGHLPIEGIDDGRFASRLAGHVEDEIDPLGRCENAVAATRRVRRDRLAVER